MRIVIACLLTSWVAAAPAEKVDLHRFEFSGTEMAAAVRVVLYAADESRAGEASRLALARIRELNSICSDYDAESELRRLCRSAAGTRVAVSEDLWRVLEHAARVSRASSGAFDVTVGPVVRLWRRARRLHRLPDADRLTAATAIVDYRFVRLDRERRDVSLVRERMRLDLGGIAKGYAADQALAVLREQGVDRALVDVGGEIALGEAPPGRSGWRIRIAGKPGDGAGAEDLCLANAAVATSGDTEQFVAIDGVRYSHIVDPRTGVGLTDRSTVTVVAPDCMTADALASAVSVLGPEKGRLLVDGTRAVECRIMRDSGGEVEAHVSAAWADLARVPSASERSRATDDSVPRPGAAPAVFEMAQETPAAEVELPKEKAATGTKDPTVLPPPSWLLEPAPLADANAGTAAEMKSYKEQIPGTDVSFAMVPIPGGEFRMGSPPAESDRVADEGPQFDARVEPFWMGRCEVTWDEYELWGLGYDAQAHAAKKQDFGPHDHLADALTRPTKPYADMTFGMGRDGFPAVCMTQLAAKVYCKWLSAKTGRYYRLPTEAEWEYACRAGTTTAYSFGDDVEKIDDYAWYYDNADDKYQKVGQKKPNPWGLHDMHGNVAEWVLDGHEPKGYAELAATAKLGLIVVPKSIYPRVVRGGSWLDDPESLRSAARLGSSNNWKAGDPQIPQSVWYHTDATFVGFRVVRPLKLPAAAHAARYDLDEAQKKTLADYLEYLADGSELAVR